MTESPSLIAPGIRLQGDLEGDGDLVVAGEVDGNIRIGGELLVTVGALVRADVVAARVRVEGTLQGRVRATRQVSVGPRGRLEAEVHGVLLVDEGGVFRGRLHGEIGPLDPPSATALLAATSGGAKAGRSTARRLAVPTPPVGEIVEGIPPEAPTTSHHKSITKEEIAVVQAEIASGRQRATVIETSPPPRRAETQPMAREPEPLQLKPSHTMLKAAAMVQPPIVPANPPPAAPKTKRSSTLPSVSTAARLRSAEARVTEPGARAPKAASEPSPSIRAPGPSPSNPSPRATSPSLARVPKVPPAQEVELDDPWFDSADNPRFDD